jgi:hypothetical protein
MNEVAIKAHTRRSKSGKQIQVKGYTRRIGRKGVHSPKREKNSGEELVAKVAEKKSPISKEELERRLKWEEDFKRSEAERKSLGMSPEKYSRYKLAESERRERAEHAAKKASEKNPLSKKGSQNILERIEDKIAKFVEKYSGKKYKRAL